MIIITIRFIIIFIVIIIIISIIIIRFFNLFSAMPRKRGANGYAKGFPESPSKKNRTKIAIRQVQKDGVSIHTAARQNGLSYGYLQRRLSGEVSIVSRNGPNPILTNEEETQIANYAKEMALRGMGLTCSDVMDIVQELLTKEKRPNPLKNNRPGYRWWYNFMARHEGSIQMRKEKIWTAVDPRLLL